MQTNHGRISHLSFGKCQRNKLFDYFKIARKELEEYPVCKNMIKEINKCVHPIPGMKFTTTSMNAKCTTLLYEYWYQLYNLIKFLSEVFVKIDSTIIPDRVSPEKQATLQKELDLKSFIRENKLVKGDKNSRTAMNISLKFNSFNTYESLRGKCESVKNDTVDDRAHSEYHTTDQYLKNLSTKYCF